VVFEQHPLPFAQLARPVGPELFPELFARRPGRQPLPHPGLRRRHFRCGRLVLPHVIQNPIEFLFIHGSASFPNG
jgi:hypothetical protein